MLVDSHAHLDGPKFAGDLHDVLSRARAAGVEEILTIGNGRGPDDVDCALRLIDQLGPIPGLKIHASIGIHPHEASLAEERHYKWMTDLARDSRVVAWGEIGLDYFYDHSPRDVQQRVFVAQLELAREACLPIIIHCRPSNNSEDAFTGCFALLRQHWAAAGLPGIMHCFTGEPEHARQALELGFYISFAGNITFPKAQNIRESAKVVPLDRMLVETDSPYLAPIPHRGQRNEPAYVAATSAYLARLLGVSEVELAEQTTGNFRRLIGARGV